ncbi:16013_t:CDS:2, partial [Gigaspora rosea]
QEWKFGSLFDDCNLTLGENSSKKEKKLQKKNVSPKLGSQNFGFRLKNRWHSHLGTKKAQFQESADMFTPKFLRVAPVIQNLKI